MPTVVIERTSSSRLPRRDSVSYDETISDEEKDLVVALAAIPGMPLPELGAETEMAVVLDFAWAEAKVGVAEDLPPEDANTIGNAGWKILETSAEQIIQKLKTNGVS